MNKHKSKIHVLFHWSGVALSQAWQAWVHAFHFTALYHVYLPHFLFYIHLYLLIHPLHSLCIVFLVHLSRCRCPSRHQHIAAKGSTPLYVSCCVSDCFVLAHSMSPDWLTSAQHVLRCQQLCKGQICNFTRLTDCTVAHVVWKSVNLETWDKSIPKQPSNNSWRTKE